jgi:hypothetical protein
MIEIQDNFLPGVTLKHLHKSFRELLWRGSRCVGGSDLMCSELDNFQLYHEFYSNYSPTGQNNSFKIIMPFLVKIKPAAIIRIKANMNMRTSKVIEHGFHTDHPYPNAKTSVYYLNTCDGYTLFEDGTKVESIENRLVTFDSSTNHSGTTCTNQISRIVINFNYYPS